MRITFLGGAGTVTGSKYLVETGRRRILVDCGLFQGLKDLRLLNWAEFPVDPRSIDAVVITHAHLDHCGYLPVLVRRGFRGAVHCTAPTRDLLKIMLLDSARIQAEDADFANRHGYSKHQPAEALYSSEDVLRTLKLVRAARRREWVRLAPGVEARFTPNGHILGSASVEIACKGDGTALFSGDLGRPSSLLYSPPENPGPADVLIVESTYGDRTHPAEQSESRLSAVINATSARKGQTIIPAFSVGRTQEILLMIHRLKKKKALPRGLPVFVDSPMATKATSVYLSHSGWHRMTEAEMDSLERDVRYVSDRRESMEISRMKAPAVVLAGSGMAAGGRVLHHLEARLGDPACCVLLAGYQAVGTRGRLLRDGVGELKFHGRYFPVRARVEALEGLSGHADQRDLLDWIDRWVESMPKPPGNVFIVHGEPQASDALRLRMRDELGLESRIPVRGEKIEF